MVTRFNFAFRNAFLLLLLRIHYESLKTIFSMDDTSRSSSRFHHDHYLYVFSFKPCRIVETVEEVICPKVIKVHSAQFKRVREDFCTYVCEYPNPTAASSAVVNLKETEVSSTSELLGCSLAGIHGVCSGVYPEVFTAIDFNCVTSPGSLVPVDFIQQILTIEDDRRRICDLVREKAVSLTCEPAKNDVVEQIIQKKIGKDFTVCKKPLTPRKKTSYNPYSRSRYDLCVQHKEKCFQAATGVLRAGVVGASEDPDGIFAMEENTCDGSVITSVMKFKMEGIKTDQTFAEMLCSLTDCGIDVLKNGKQISKAIIFGLSVDYRKAEVTVHKMTLNFTDNSFHLLRLKDKMTLSDSLNFVIAALSN